MRNAQEDRTWAGDKGFVGGTQDTTNQLTNLGAREYDAALGRFLTPDPLINEADPQQWNEYQYADNNPVSKSDPDGKMVRGFDGLGYGRGAQADKAAGRWIARQNVIRHNIARDAAARIIRKQVAAQGGDPSKVQTEYRIPHGSKYGKSRNKSNTRNRRFRPANQYAPGSPHAPFLGAASPSIQAPHCRAGFVQGFLCRTSRRCPFQEFRLCPLCHSSKLRPSHDLLAPSVADQLPCMPR